MRSGLARSIHPSHATVRVAAALTVLSGSVAGVVALIQGDTLSTAIQHGVLAGGAAFIAWAITRETAPDHPITAGAAGALAPFLLIGGPADLLAAGLVILPVRIVAGTTGRDLTPIDVAAVGIGAVVVGFRESGVVVAIALALGPAASAVWAHGRRRMLVASSGVILAAVLVVVLVIADHDPWLRPTGFAQGLLVGGVAAGLVAAWIVPTVSSRVDSRRGGLVRTSRIRLARIAALVICVSTALWAGDPGVVALGPAWAALAVTAVSSIATMGDDS